MNSVWNGLYTVIHRANTVIDNGPEVKDNTALRDRCVAEAKFFRGWAYFELVSMWGAVPLYTKQVTTPDQFQPRAYCRCCVHAGIPGPERCCCGARRGDHRPGSGHKKELPMPYLDGPTCKKGDYANAKTALLAVNPGGSVYGLRSNYLDNFDEEHEFNNESIFEAVFFDRGDNNFNWGYTGDDQPNAQPQSTVRNQEYSPLPGAT